MIAVIASGLASALVAAATFLFGLRHGRRQHSAREAVLESRIAELRHVADTQRHAASTVAQHAIDAMEELVVRSAKLLRDRQVQP